MAKAKTYARRRKWGVRLTSVTLRFDPAFVAALKEFVVLEEQRSPLKLGQGYLLEKLALAQSPKLAQLYQQHLSGSPSEKSLTPGAKKKS